MSTPQTEEYLEARRESCRLLGLNADDLTPHEMIRADLLTVLRLWLDGSQSALLSGGTADPTKILAVADVLGKLVPEPEHKSRREDPRAHMWRTYSEMRRRGELAEKIQEPRLREQIAALQAEIATLRAGGATAPPAALPLPDAKVITPPTSDIVPPGEIGKTFVGPQRGPDDPPVRSTQVIDGKAEQPPRPLRIGEQWDPVRGFRPIPPQPNAAPAPPPSSAPAATPGYDYDAQPQEWKNYVQPSGEISMTPMSGNRRWWGPV
jgi:hypothetical protein